MEWYFAIIIGIVLLYLGSEWLVDGAKKLALRLGIAPFVVGLTVLAFGSSSPECITSIVSTSNPSIIIGNVVGSNIANIGLAIGMAALINPMTAKYTSMRFEIIAMVGSAILLGVMGLFGVVNMIEGFILMGLLFVFLFIVYKSKKDDKEGQESYVADIGDVQNINLPICIIKIIAGLVALYFGADFFVDGAVNFAHVLGVSELFIGLIVVAIGTSLPELCICLMASYRGENELAVSNIVGSNIFNIFFVLGIGAALVDVPISQPTMYFHLPVMIILTLIMFLMVYKKNCITKKMGAFLLVLYIAYIVTMALVPSLTM